MRFTIVHPTLLDLGQKSLAAKDFSGREWCDCYSHRDRLGGPRRALLYAGCGPFGSDVGSRLLQILCAWSALVCHVQASSYHGKMKQVSPMSQQKVREKIRRYQKKEDEKRRVRRKKMSWNCVFPRFHGSRGSIGRLATQGAEVSVDFLDQNIASCCGERAVWKSNSLNAEVWMFKICIPLWRESCPKSK